jgi:ABC-type dipeptide/oligopeptide/nickel transport system permease component
MSLLRYSLRRLGQAGLVLLLVVVLQFLLLHLARGTSPMSSRERLRPLTRPSSSNCAVTWDSTGR